MGEPVIAPAPIEPLPLEPLTPTLPDASTPAPLDPIAPIMPTSPTLPSPNVPDAATPQLSPTPTEGIATSPSTPRSFEFQNEDIGTVLRLLARQSKINLVVSDLVQGLITMRLEDVTALQAINVIVTAKGLVMDVLDNVYYVKTAGEKAAEPTEGASYTFSFARAEAIAPLLAAQLQSKSAAPQVDPRTNTIFYREAKSNLGEIASFLSQVDRPTKQVMIEARLVEVAANPRQSFGINWSGVVGSSTNAKTFSYGGSVIAEDGTPPTGLLFDEPTGSFPLGDFIRAGGSGAIGSLAGQFAILSIPQLSVTLRALNEDSDAEFLANPRIVTADNMEATIKVVTQRPVPSLNFNEQTATATFGGFDNYEFGSTLVVRPSVNKDNFINLTVRPEISNSNQDATFVIDSSVVSAPIIDTRILESNVLIKSGNTLVIGGLLQDQTTKARNKVPILGDIPVIGYLFQERLNARTKRNLLVFVTPTVIDPETGTGLENQIYGLRYSGEEFADPNGWLNNARGVYRLVPTSESSIAAEYPVPGMPQPPRFQNKPSPRE